MDVKLVNPFIDAFTTVLPQMGFPTPERTGMGVKDKHIESLGVSVLVGFTKEIRGNVVYNMNEETAKFIASTMMMGMPISPNRKLDQLEPAPHSMDREERSAVSSVMMAGREV